MTKGLGQLAAVAALFALAAGAACTVQQADTAPPLTGPSGFAQSITVTATPDRITQDGLSQSAIGVRVFDANGQPANAVPLRVDILANGTVVDFGTLSTKSIVTGSDGRATTVYTAPPAPPSTQGGNTSTVTIRAVAIGSDAQASNSFTADIRLVPPGVILPPAGTPTASFTTSPSALLAGLPVNFDASPSQAGSGASAITSYAWSFGDGSSGAGRTTTKTFASANTFSVTLTVTNDRGVSASVTQAVTVDAASAPAAAFNFSPASPGTSETVFFNASASLPAQGRTISAYRWTFGDGGTASGITTSHAYVTAGTYTVTLTVTDDLGQPATTTQSVVVGSPPSPTARFTFSPTQPTVNETVVYSASTSSTAQGQTITDYFWNFGDDPSCPAVSGAPPSTCYVQTSAPVISHPFARAGNFNVNLVVRDSAGRIGSTSNTVPVGSGNPVPVITVSPPSPVRGSAAIFDGTGTTTSGGATIASYTWTFGDNTASQTGSVTTHTYASSLPAGTYVVRLTVVDNQNRSGTTTVTVTVQ